MSDAQPVHGATGPRDVDHGPGGRPGDAQPVHGPGADVLGRVAAALTELGTAVAAQRAALVASLAVPAERIERRPLAPEVAEAAEEAARVPLPPGAAELLARIAGRGRDAQGVHAPGCAGPSPELPTGVDEEAPEHDRSCPDPRGDTGPEPGPAPEGPQDAARPHAQAVHAVTWPEAAPDAVPVHRVPVRAAQVLAAMLAHPDPWQDIRRPLAAWIAPPGTAAPHALPPRTPEEAAAGWLDLTGDRARGILARLRREAPGSVVDLVTDAGADLDGARIAGEPIERRPAPLDDLPHRIRARWQAEAEHAARAAVLGDLDRSAPLLGILGDRRPLAARPEGRTVDQARHERPRGIRYPGTVPTPDGDRVRPAWWVAHRDALPAHEWPPTVADAYGRGHAGALYLDRAGRLYGAPAHTPPPKTGETPAEPWRPLSGPRGLDPAVIGRTWAHDHTRPVWTPQDGPLSGPQTSTTAAPAPEGPPGAPQAEDGPHGPIPGPCHACRTGCPERGGPCRPLADELPADVAADLADAVRAAVRPLDVECPQCWAPYRVACQDDAGEECPAHDDRRTLAACRAGTLADGRGWTSGGEPTPCPMPHGCTGCVLRPAVEAPQEAPDEGPGWDGPGEAPQEPPPCPEEPHGPLACPSDVHTIRGPLLVDSLALVPGPTPGGPPEVRPEDGPPCLVGCHPRATPGSDATGRHWPGCPNAPQEAPRGITHVHALHELDDHATRGHLAHWHGIGDPGDDLGAAHRAAHALAAPQERAEDVAAGLVAEDPPEGPTLHHTAEGGPTAGPVLRPSRRIELGAGRLFLAPLRTEEPTDLAAYLADPDEWAPPACPQAPYADPEDQAGEWREVGMVDASALTFELPEGYEDPEHLAGPVRTWGASLSVSATLAEPIAPDAWRLLFGARLDDLKASAHRGRSRAAMRALRRRAAQRRAHPARVAPWARIRARGWSR